MTDAVQDGRRRNFFMVDNALIDGFGPEVGAYGVAVYTVLARMAGQKGTCFPAHDTIAQALNVSPSTVKRALNALDAAGLVRIDSRSAGEGLQTSNVYTLLSLDTAPAPAAATPAAQPTKPVRGLWDSVVGPVQDAPDHRAQVGALCRVWPIVFGPDTTITPAQAESLLTAAGGQPVAVAQAALKAAAGVAPPIRSPYALVLQSLTRQRGPAKPAGPRREPARLGYGTVPKPDDDTPF